MEERAFEAELVDGVLWLRGVVDDYGYAALRTALDEALAPAPARLVVNLSDVDYLPSVAVGVLTKAMGTAQRSGVRLQLVAREGSMSQRVLMITGLPFVDEAGHEPPQHDLPA